MYLHIYLKFPLLYLAKRGNSVRKNSRKPMYIYFEFSPLNFVTKIKKKIFCSISTLIFIYTLAMNKSLQKSFYRHIFSLILLFSSLFNCLFVFGKVCCPCDVVRFSTFFIGFNWIDEKKL